MKKTTKICITCKKEKNKECFLVGKGIGKNCISCHNENKKRCVLCNEIRSLDNFYNPVGFKCKICAKKETNENRENNLEKIKEEKRIYYLENKNNILKKDKERRDDNRDEINKRRREKRQYRIDNEPGYKERLAYKQKIYAEDHKNELNKKANDRSIKRRKIDPAYKCRQLVSTQIFITLKKQKMSKNGYSCWKYLPYTPDELVEHIENQWESWMNWENWGKYDPKTWNEQDSTTWKWQLDHKDPQSDFLYDSMEHPNFLKCWSLENLRPLSAKRNILDGIERTRHKKK